MAEDETKTDTTTATNDSAQQNQDAANADPKAVADASTAGTGDAAQNSPVQSESDESDPTFGDKAEAIITEAEEEFRTLWADAEFEADEIIEFFKNKLNPKA